MHRMVQGRVQWAAVSRVGLLRGKTMKIRVLTVVSWLLSWQPWRARRLARVKIAARAASDAIHTWDAGFAHTCVFSPTACSKGGRRARADMTLRRATSRARWKPSGSTAGTKGTAGIRLFHYGSLWSMQAKFAHSGRWRKRRKTHRWERLFAFSRHAASGYHR